MNIGTLFATTMLNAGNALFNGGTLTFYSGSPPATPETAPTGTVLCTFTFSATAFAAPALSGGYEGAAAAFTSTSANPVASGTVGYARATESNGTTYICDYTVATSGADITIGNTGIQVGVPVTLSSFQNRIPAL